jgi:uncharacterized membrane protein YoaK (UPF0700 family)
MIHKLERWAWVGGALLAGNAGMVNAVGLQSFVHQAVTHVTGTTTLFSLALAHGDGAALLNTGLVLAAFAGGAALGGFVVQNAALKLGRRYGVALLLESLLLTTAANLMHSHLMAGSYCASAACGLQNAMASTYSGSVLRTTHLSGMFTDFGAAVGHFLRGATVDWIRVRLYGLLIGAFIGGGLVGALLFDVFAYETLYVPAGLTGIIGLAYMAYVHRWREKNAR